MRIGHGYDVHRLVPGRKLILGGVQIPYALGLDGHSDADVLLHAVMDALLGAAGLGDIGRLFPDTDDQYLGISSLVLLENGVIYRENLKKARLDLNEFLTFCRIGGWFDLNQLQSAVLEHNGVVSFLPKEADRPATPADLNLNPKQSKVQMPFVMDGRLLEENIRQAGKEDTWVRRTLLQQGCRDEGEVLLAVWDGGEKLTVFPMDSAGKRKRN